MVHWVWKVKKMVFGPFFFVFVSSFLKKLDYIGEKRGFYKVIAFFT